MKKCGKPCQACPYVYETKMVKGKDFIWKIGKQLNCESKNIIYMIECRRDNCKKSYIGETDRSMKERFSEYKDYAKNKHLNQPTGLHFNENGHGLENMKITIIEKIKNKN